jgi:hypothetical protein
MGKIIFCDDLILRVDDSEDLTNVTEWLLESTEYRPSAPESCTVRSAAFKPFYFDDKVEKQKHLTNLFTI